MAFGGFAVNKKKWESLPTEVRDVLKPIALEYAMEVWRDCCKTWGREAPAWSALKEGAKVSTLPEDERKRWADSMPNLRKAWVEDNEKKGVPASRS